MENRVSLAKAINQLRQELVEARAGGSGKEVQFEVEGAEIELQVGMTKEGGAGGSVSFWVFSVEASGKLASEVVQTLRLKLRPKGPDGRAINVADSSGPPPR